MRLLLRFCLASFAAFSALPALAQPTNVVKLNVVHQGQCQTPCERVAVIFVHGITGSKETWRNPRTQAFFPEMLSKDVDLRASVDVYHLDFESFRFSGPPMDKIGAAVAKAVDPLIKAKKYSRVVFIGHSLGGLVARAYLIHVKFRYGHQGLIRFPIIISISTPFEGSSLASFGTWVSGNEHLRILVPIRENDFQKLVNDGMAKIQSKMTECASLGSITELVHFSAYETKPITAVGIIVSQQSATGLAKEPFPVAKDHWEIGKPENVNDQPFPWVKQIVQRCIARDGICTARKSNCGPDFFRP